MKIQSLGIIAIIIILPMIILLSAYTENQMKTVKLQSEYDSRLTSATYDAVKAFQLNMSNSSSSDLADSKMRDIKAGIATFYNSLSTNFSSIGTDKTQIKSYIPAVVYTLYDGYYIYSEYINTLDVDIDETKTDTYKNGDELYGLKPYIYYSCRYKGTGTNGKKYDIVITYSLDSYITIQGIVNDDQNINDSGYLLSNVASDGSTYRGFDIIDKERQEQKVYIDKITTDENIGELKKLFCKKIDGVKYYNDNGNVISILNDTVQGGTEGLTVDKINNNTSARDFYREAYEFKQRLKGYRFRKIK